MTETITILVMLALTWVVWRYSCPTRRARNLFTLGVITWLAWLGFGCPINAMSAVQGLLPIIAGIIPMLAAMADLVLPQDAALIEAAANLAQTGLNDLINALKSYNAAPSDSTLGKLVAAFNSVHDQLTQLVNTVAGKNATLAAKITGIVNGAISILASVEAQIHTDHPAKVAEAQAQAAQQ
jgi:methyl-accepting chemotaxis protein